MHKPKITVVDYGVGNLLSVQRGLEHCGAEVCLTDDPQAVLFAERLVLPGVGAFANAMNALQERDLIKPIKMMAEKGTPLLGICLGMQLLLDESEEFGSTQGLGLIPGRVVPIPTKTDDGKIQKIPHIGWNGLILGESCQSWMDTLLQDNRSGEAVYFVHSYMSVTDKASDRLADCLYGGQRVSAVIARGNITGCQFHPEKSGEVGLKILRRFCAN